MNQDHTQDIEQVLAVLDRFGRSDTSRLNIRVSEEQLPDTVEKQYHHGRCDIGSPWAKGTPFDVLDQDGCR